MLLCTKQVISVKLSRPMSKIWRPPVCPMLPAWKAGTRLMFARVSWQTCRSQKRRRGGLSEIFLGFSVAGDVRINRSRRGKKGQLKYWWYSVCFLVVSHLGPRIGFHQCCASSFWTELLSWKGSFSWSFSHGFCGSHVEVEMPTYLHYDSTLASVWDAELHNTRDTGFCGNICWKGRAQ